MTFDDKVEALVEKLGEDIAAAASDGDEYANGLMAAAILLLDTGANTEVDILDEAEDLDDLFDEDDDDDDDEAWFGSSSLFDEDDEDELPF